MRYIDRVVKYDKSHVVCVGTCISLLELLLLVLVDRSSSLSASASLKVKKSSMADRTEACNEKGSQIYPYMYSKTRLKEIWIIAISRFMATTKTLLFKLAKAVPFFG